MSFTLNWHIIVTAHLTVFRKFAEFAKVLLILHKNQIKNRYFDFLYLIF